MDCTVIKVVALYHFSHSWLHFNKYFYLILSYLTDRFVSLMHISPGVINA